MKLLKLLRGIAGTAALWGAGFIVLAIPTVATILSPDAPPLGWSSVPGLLVPLLAYPIVHGAICGALFALLLSATSRRVKSVEQLPVARTAALGAVAGVVMPFLVNGGHIALLEAAIGGALGVTTATASLLVARRSAPALVEASAQPQVDAGRPTEMLK